MTLTITQNHVRAKHRHLPCTCTRRHHLLHSAYKRVFAYRGNNLQRANLVRYTPGGIVLREGCTYNFWPLRPALKGDNGHRILTDWAEPTVNLPGGRVSVFNVEIA